MRLTGWSRHAVIALGLAVMVGIVVALVSGPSSSPEITKICENENSKLQYTKDKTRYDQAVKNCVEQAKYADTVAPYLPYIGGALAFVLYLLFGRNIKLSKLKNNKIFYESALSSKVIFWIILVFGISSLIIGGLYSYHSIGKGIGIAGFLALAFCFFFRKAFFPDEEENLGQASWGEPAKVGRGSGSKLWAGTSRGQPVEWATEKHVFIMASAGSGKGTSMIIPNLLKSEGSVFVLDPKGENARATARRRRDLGKVAILDPYKATQSPSPRADLLNDFIGFNPLAAFRPDRLTSDAAQLAAALILDQPGGERDPYWNNGARDLLQAVILHVCTAPESELPGKRDLMTVRRLIMRDFAPADPPDGSSTLEKLALNEAEHGLIADKAGALLGTNPKERSTFLSNVITQTAFLQYPEMRAVLSADAKQVDFEEFRSGVLSVFVCLPAPEFSVLSGWLRLVLNAALGTMMQRLAPPKHQVRFFLDEVAILGRLDVIENAVGLVRGYGVQLWTIWQDLGQVKDLYKDRHTSFMGNAGLQAYFGISDPASAEYISSCLGPKTIDLNQTKHSRPLLYQNEVMSFPDMILLLQDEPESPLFVERTPYYQRQDLKGLWDDPRE